MIFGPEDTNVAEGRANSPSNHMLPETLGQHLFYSLHYRCKYIFKQQPVLYVACFRSAQIKQILISFAQRSNNFYIGLADRSTTNLDRLHFIWYLDPRMTRSGENNLAMYTQ